MVSLDCAYVGDLMRQNTNLEKQTSPKDLMAVRGHPALSSSTISDFYVPKLWFPMFFIHG